MWPLIKSTITWNQFKCVVIATLENTRTTRSFYVRTDDNVDEDDDDIDSLSTLAPN